MIKAKKVLAVVLAFATAGCTAGALDSPWPSHRDSYLLRGERRSLDIFNGMPQGVREALLRSQPNLAPNQLERLRLDCGGEPDPSVPSPAFAPAVLAPLAAAGLTAAIQFIGSETKRAIDEWASSFEAQWSGRYVGYFYAQPGATAPGQVAEVKLNGRCFVLERQVESNRTVYLMIGQFEPSADGFALRIRPLFQQHIGTKARVGTGGRFVSALTLTIEAVWSDARSGVTATRNTVLTTSMDFGEQTLGASADGLIAEPARSAMASTWFPLVPVSREASGRLVGRGPVNMTATVLETAIARDLAGAAARAAGQAVDQGVQAGMSQVQRRIGGSN